MRKIWTIKPQNIELQKKLAAELNISAVLAQLLINRNLTEPKEIERFLTCNRSGLHDPFKLKGMRKAVERIRKAIREKEKILIYGDYDVDGITAVAILNTFLKREGALVSWRIPNRLEEGYGLNLEAAKFIKAKGIKLLITVDCGTTDKEEVDFLNKHGVDTVIIDHHQVRKEVLPDAYALVNPLQQGCDYPFKGLSGVGLTYKLICALLEDTGHLSDEFLDLVALGTVADVVSQTDENRILTRLGLGKLTNTSRIGLKALMEIAGIHKKNINTQHIGFVIGPRINVGGRISSPDLALKLLLSEKEEEAKEIADVLNQENSFRQRLQEGIMKEAVSKIEGEFNFKDQKVIVVWGKDWHPGVVGIVASKIADRFYRPTIVFNINNGIAKGSGRSIENFHLFDAVYECKHLLENFGGHKAACGITISSDRVEKFREEINSVAQKMLTAEDLMPKIDVDMEIPLSYVNRQLISDLDKLSPFGAGNPPPLFLSAGLKLKDSPAPYGRNGIKMWVTDKKTTCEAVCFNSFDLSSQGLGDLKAIDLVYYPKVKKSFGIDTFQLEVEDLKPA